MAGEGHDGGAEGSYRPCETAQRQLLKEGHGWILTILGFTVGEFVKKVLLGSGVTAGAIATYQLFEIAKKDPRALETVLGWGPIFVIAVALIFMVDRRLGMGIEALQNNAVAQERMSDAMQRIAEKDDREAEELKRLVSYNALQSDKVLARMDDHTRVLNQVVVDQGKHAEQLKRQEFYLAQIGEQVKRSKTAIELDVPADRARGAKA